MADLFILCIAAISTMAAVGYWLDREHARAIAENQQAKCRIYRSYIERMLDQNRQQQAELAELRAHRAKRLAAVRKYAENRKQKGKQA